MSAEIIEVTVTDAPVKQKKVKKENPASTGPKKPLTAFMCFSTATRSKILAENPNIAFGDVGKTLGKMWREMTDDQKVPFTTKAKEEKERYEAAIKLNPPAPKSKKVKRMKKITIPAELMI